MPAGGELADDFATNRSRRHLAIAQELGTGQLVALAVRAGRSEDSCPRRANVPRVHRSILPRARRKAKHAEAHDRKVVQEIRGEEARPQDRPLDAESAK